MRDFLDRYIKETGKSIKNIKSEFKEIVKEKEIKSEEKNFWVKIYSCINQYLPLKGFFTYALLTITLSGLISLGFPYLLLELFSTEAEIYKYIWPFFFLLLFLTWIFKSVILARLASLILAFLTSIISISIINEEYPNEITQLGLFEFISIVLAITSILVVVFEIILAEFKKRSLLK